MPTYAKSLRPVLPMRKALPESRGELRSAACRAYRASDGWLYVLPAADYLPPEVVSQAIDHGFKTITLGKDCFNYFDKDPSASWCSGHGGDWPGYHGKSDTYFHRILISKISAVTVFRVDEFGREWWKSPALHELNMGAQSGGSNSERVE